jgi:hypothetical protein
MYSITLCAFSWNIKRYNGSSFTAFGLHILKISRRGHFCAQFSTPTIFQATSNRPTYRPTDRLANQPINQHGTVFLEKLAVPQLVKKLLHFTEAKSTLPR